ncbi:hypothetical protein LSAT2_009732 [Lamellibrachia satsuma]|nr:hypothetical protein LSAT2_009732 [Lamellibrachia satsuma]
MLFEHHFSIFQRFLKVVFALCYYDYIIVLLVVNSCFLAPRNKTPQSFETNTPLKTVPLLNPANRLLSLVEKFVPGPGTSDDDLDSTVQEWVDFQLKGWGGQVRFDHLATLMKTLVILPYDQAKNDKKFRASLSAETLCSLLYCKINVDCEYHQLYNEDHRRVI